MASQFLLYLILDVILSFHACEAAIKTAHQAPNRLNDIHTVGEYMQTCPRGSSYKTVPSLLEFGGAHVNGTCSDWFGQMTCCTHDTVAKIESGSIYGFDRSHCKTQRNSSLNKACNDFFQRELCFYECSPNLGPWLVKLERKISSERAYGVPLCKEDCLLWWDACKDAQTCVENWAYEFEWKSGVNACPTNAPCRSFKEIFGNHQRFCENIWDGYWSVTTSPECTHFARRFSPVFENNHRVAKREAIRIIERLSSYGMNTFQSRTNSCLLLLLNFWLVGTVLMQSG